MGRGGLHALLLLLNEFVLVGLLFSNAARCMRGLVVLQAVHEMFVAQLGGLLLRARGQAVHAAAGCHGLLRAASAVALHVLLSVMILLQHLIRQHVWCDGDALSVRVHHAVESVARGQRRPAARVARHGAVVVAVVRQRQRRRSTGASCRIVAMGMETIRQANET